MRSGAGRSDVATTTTERLRPSGPNSFSRNARTSRLRSPTSAITLTSASLCRDMAPSKVLLPTPLPPKIPTLCPLPQGSRPSMARMPVTSGFTMCSRSSGWGGAAYKGYAMEARTGGPSSIGRPNPSSTRPSKPGPTRNNASSRRAITRSPGCRPSVSSSGIDNTRSLRKPITCERMERPDAVRISTKSPVETTGPRDAMSRPTTSVTSPIQGSTSIAGTCGIKSRMDVLGGAILSFQLVDQPALNLAQLRFHRSVQNALRGLKENFRGLQVRIRRQHQVFGRAGLFQQFTHQRFQRGMHAHAVNLARLQFRKRGLDQAGQRVRIHHHFAMDHTRGNGGGQMHQILHRFFANVFAQPRQHAERLSQALHGGP